MEALWQIRESKIQLSQANIHGVTDATVIAAGDSETELEDPHEGQQCLPVVAAPVAIAFGLHVVHLHPETVGGPNLSTVDQTFFHACLMDVAEGIFHVSDGRWQVDCVRAQEMVRASQEKVSPRFSPKRKKHLTHKEISA